MSLNKKLQHKVFYNKVRKKQQTNKQTKMPRKICNLYNCILSLFFIKLLIYVIHDRRRRRRQFA